MIEMSITSRVSGSGPKIILLHGYAGSVSHWREVATELEATHTVIVLNYGPLYLGREAFSFSSQVDQVGQWIEKNFPGEKVTLAGISFGGALAWGLGLKFPNLVEKTIFINPMMPAPGQQFLLTSMRLFFTIPLSRNSVHLFLSTKIGGKFLKTCAGIFRLQSEKDANRLMSLEGKRRLLLAHLFNNFAWILKQEHWAHWHDLLSQWKHSSLFIYDSQDPLFKAEAYFNLAQRLRSKIVMDLPGAGHIAIQGAPAEIAKAIKDFSEGFRQESERSSSEKSKVA